MIKKTIIILIIFCLGIASAQLTTYVRPSEKPLSFNILGESTAPFGTISRDNIEIYPDKVIIYLNDASLSRYADTGSMLPILDKNTKGIKIPVTSPDQIQIGDIITYKRDGSLIIHRVINIGIDEEGIYYITKGDNNFIVDEKVRFEDVMYELVALVY